jgi:hypothetical protein
LVEDADIEPKLSQRDWAGVLAVVFVGGFFALLGLSMYLDKPVEQLDTIFGIIATIAVLYFGKKLP